MPGGRPTPGRGGGPAQSLTEYGLIVAAVSILVLLGAHAFGALIYDWFQSILAILMRQIV